MKRYKFLVFLMLLIALFSCSDDEDTTPLVDPVRSVSVSPDALELSLWKTAVVRAIVDNPGGLTTVKWTTSNPRVATVSENGVITATGTGEATVTATALADNTTNGSVIVRVTSEISLTIPEQSATVAVQPGNQVIFRWNSSKSFSAGYTLLLSLKEDLSSAFEVGVNDPFVGVSSDQIAAYVNNVIPDGGVGTVWWTVKPTNPADNTPVPAARELRISRGNPVPSKIFWTVASFSSQWGAYFPANIFDGSRNIFWHSDPNGQMPQWIIVDFSEEAFVTGVVLTRFPVESHRFHPRHIRFEISNDQVNWKLLLEKPALPNIREPQTLHMDTPNSGRYFRMTILSTHVNGGKYSYMGEIDVF